MCRTLSGAMTSACATRAGTVISVPGPRLVHTRRTLVWMSSNTSRSMRPALRTNRSTQLCQWLPTVTWPLVTSSLCRNGIVGSKSRSVIVRRGSSCPCRPPTGCSKFFTGPLHDEGMTGVVLALVLRLLFPILPDVVCMKHELETLLRQIQARFALEVAPHGLHRLLALPATAADLPDPLHGLDGTHGERSEE